MKKELIYILCILFVLYAIHGFPMDMETFTGISRIDINFYDTYFVFSSAYYWFVILSFAFSIAYLIRVFLSKFKNRYVNIIYIITNGSFIVSLIFMINFFNLILEHSSEEGLATNKNFYTFFYITIALLLFAIIMEILVLFKMWKK